jgi:hypothetical protein
MLESCPVSLFKPRPASGPATAGSEERGTGSRRTGEGSGWPGYAQGGLRGNCVALAEFTVRAAPVPHLHKSAVRRFCACDLLCWVMTACGVGADDERGNVDQSACEPARSPATRRPPSSAG